MSKGFKQTGGTGIIDRQYNTAEIIVMISNWCNLSGAKNLILFLKFEDSCIQVFHSRIRDVVDCIALLCSKEQISLL